MNTDALRPDKKPGRHLQHHKLLHLIRFLAVGGLNTAFGYCLFAVLIWAGLKAELAILIGNIIGPLFNYVTYGKLAFNRKLGRHNLPLFLGNYAAFYVINIALLWLLRDWLQLSDYLTQLILTPFLALGMFLSLRFIVFRKQD